ncbi:MAG: hypothetical protein P8P74_02570 [Crocinitomicaceae bacterium]|nr:hypothetical protein [Crocinitomicaceae bacterium]
MKRVIFVYILILSAFTHAQDSTEIISFDGWEFSFIQSDDIEITPPIWPRSSRIGITFKQDSLEEVNIFKHPYHPSKLSLMEQFNEDLRGFKLINTIEEKWSFSERKDSIEVHVIGYAYEAKHKNMYDQKPKGKATYGILQVNSTYYMIESSSLDRKDLV